MTSKRNGETKYLITDLEIESAADLTNLVAALRQGECLL
jgi:hypothetical protein